MTFSKKLFLTIAVVVALGTFGVNYLKGRTASQSPATQSAKSSAPNSIELVASDVVLAEKHSMTQGLPISGTLKANRSAMVKARVVGELMALDVREGDAVKAGQDRERLKNEGQAYANDIIPKARGAADRLMQEAEGYKAKVTATAEGDATRFKLIQVEYAKAPQVTRERMYIDAMQEIYTNVTKVMVDQRSSNGSLLYLPLDKLIQQVGSNPTQLPLQTSNTMANTPANTSDDDDIVFYALSANENTHAGSTGMYAIKNTPSSAQGEELWFTPPHS